LSVTHYRPFWFVVIAALFIVGYAVYPKNSATNDEKPNSMTVMDIDGNVYRTLKIGNQTWIMENLKTTRLNDGQSIPYKPGASDWATLMSPGYCWPDGDPSNSEDYGALYNWYVVNTGKLAPNGWHVATDEEWSTLTAYLGGNEVAGGNLKKMNFTVHFAGLRTNAGEFGYIEKMEKYWTATEGGWHSGDAWYYTITKLENELGKSSHMKLDGQSVRCVKDS
jgi:uncharacterized protein (TIGR02145 family)